MEGVSYSLNDCLNVLKEMNIKTSDMALCGGGAKSEFWRQMIADVFGISVKTMQSDEGPALGVAILAGCAAGVYKSVEEGCQTVVKEKLKTEHNTKNHEIYEKFYNIYKSLYPDLEKAFKALSDC